MFLPFSLCAKDWEPDALKLRSLLHLSDSDLLDPYELAPLVGLRVMDALEVCASLEPEVSRHILGPGRDSWSGGVLAEPLPDGSRICILNPTHGSRRKRITLMEEIAHVSLGHVPTELRRQRNGLRVRDYNVSQEEQAYGIGAAALIPWSVFFRQLNSGMRISAMAERYRVSEALIRYRISITGASNLYHARQRAGRSKFAVTSKMAC